MLNSRLPVIWPDTQLHVHFFGGFSNVHISTSSLTRRGLGPARGLLLDPPRLRGRLLVRGGLALGRGGLGGGLLRQLGAHGRVGLDLRLGAGEARLGRYWVRVSPLTLTPSRRACAASTVHVT